MQSSKYLHYTISLQFPVSTVYSEVSAFMQTGSRVVITNSFSLHPAVFQHVSRPRQPLEDVGSLTFRQFLYPSTGETAFFFNE